MPKDPWTYKRRKRRSKGKVQQVELIETPRLSDPGETSTSIELISEMSLNNPVKNEEDQEKIYYPDTRFPHSTTLFPAAGVERKSLPGSLSDAFKRVNRDKLSSTAPKKMKLSESTKITQETFSDDCIILENPPKNVEVADSCETISDDCIIIEDSYQKVQVKVEVVDLTDDSNRSVPILCAPVRTSFLKNRKPNITFNANADVQVKVESDEKTCKMNTIHEKSKENQTSKHTYTKTHDTGLTPELSSENGDVNGQVQVTNTISVCVVKNETDARISDNHLFNDVPVKVEQNENCVVSDNATSVSKLASDANKTGINSVDRPVNSKQNKTQNCEVSENYMTVQTPSFINRPEIPSDIPVTTENLSNAINEQHTNEKVKDWLASCSINNEKVVCDGYEIGADSSYSVISAAQVKKEPKEIDSQQMHFNCEKAQKCDDILQNNNNSAISSATSISIQMDRINISPITCSGMFSGDSQLREPGTFSTPLLKYLNLNTKVDLSEISNALSYLSHMIKVNENVEENIKRSEPSPLLNMTNTVASLKRSESPNNLPMERKKHRIGELLSNDFLRQILDKAKPIPKSNDNIFYPS